MDPQIDPDLENLYMPSAWCKGDRPRSEVLGEFFKACIEQSKCAIASLPSERNVEYGDSRNQVLDIFYPEGYIPSGDYPVLIFIHGGYWHEPASNKDLYAFMAGPFVNKGVVMVILEYDLAPEVKMAVMVNQIEKAMTFVLSKFSHSRCVFVSGHSAGAHLASMYLARANSLPSTGVLKGAILHSGIFDLKPLLKTSVNGPLMMTEADALALSPVTVIDDIVSYCRANSVHVLVPVGSYESPAFIAQSNDITEKLLDAGVTCEFFMLDDKNHFDGIGDMVRPDYPLNLKIMEMMGV